MRWSCLVLSLTQNRGPKDRTDGSGPVFVSQQEIRGLDRTLRSSSCPVPVYTYVRVLPACLLTAGPYPDVHTLTQGYIIQCESTST
jgi:hypothetical protein